MNEAERREVEELARRVFADENVGQVIVGRDGITVYRVTGTAPVFAVVFPERGLEAAIAALRTLAGNPPIVAAGAAPVIAATCVHTWEETGRDLGTAIETDLIFQRCTLCGAEQSLELERKCEHGNPWGACTVKDCLHCAACDDMRHHAAELGADDDPGDDVYKAPEVLEREGYK